MELTAERFSVWPFAGLALLVLGWIAFDVAKRDAHAVLERQRDELLRRSAAAQPARAHAELKEPGPGEPPLLVVLPASTRRADDLKTLFRLARQRGLSVAQVDYLRSAGSAAWADGLQLNMPLAGSYPQIRRFAEDALRALPHLSLDQIAFERDAVANPAPTARLELTLWYRSGAAIPWDAAASGVSAAKAGP
jgi:Tfp pilus assembly protein PilO